MKAYDIVMEQRKKIVEEIINNIETKNLSWEKGWKTFESRPQNPVSNAKYKGANRLILNYYSYKKEYSDPRWVTFIQLKEKGWTLKKGAKAVQCEKWIFTKDVKEKDENGKEIIVKEKLKKPIVNYFNLFNAQEVEGIPELEKKEKLVFTNEELVDLLKKSSICEIREINQDRAFYSSAKDEIILPLKEDFNSEEDFIGTMIHEMVHSTGHESRLDRKLGNQFGSIEYAKEELIAELGAIFLQEELGVDIKGKHFENHSAYLENWLEVLKKDYNQLFQASVEAEKSTDLLFNNYMKELEIVKEKNNTVDKYKELEIKFLWSEHDFNIPDGTILKGQKAYDFVGEMMRADKESQDKNYYEKTKIEVNLAAYISGDNLKTEAYSTGEIRIDLGCNEFKDAKKVSEALYNRLISFPEDIIKNPSYYKDFFDKNESIENIKEAGKELYKKVSLALMSVEEEEFKEILNSKKPTKRILRKKETKEKANER